MKAKNLKKTPRIVSTFPPSSLTIIKNPISTRKHKRICLISGTILQINGSIRVVIIGNVKSDTSAIPILETFIA